MKFPKKEMTGRIGQLAHPKVLLITDNASPSQVEVLVQK